MVTNEAIFVNNNLHSLSIYLDRYLYYLLVFF